MPWDTFGGEQRQRLYSLRTRRNDDDDAAIPPPNEHDADERPIDYSEPPDEALARLLRGSLPPSLLALLLAPLASDADLAAAAVHVRALATETLGTTLALPRRWLPYGASAEALVDRAIAVPGRTFFAAVWLRVNALEDLAVRVRVLEAAPTVIAATRAVGYYVHAWLDAHLLAALELGALADVPEDASAATRAIRAAYAPSAATHLHEGEMPSLVGDIERCSFFTQLAAASARGDAAVADDADADDDDDGDDDDDDDDDEDGEAEEDAETSSGEDARPSPLTSLFNKTIPRRCGVRNVIANIETLVCRDDAIMDLLCALLAASLLGVYRHARARPPLDERLRLYRAFFWRNAAVDDVAGLLARPDGGDTAATRTAYLRARGAAGAAVGTPLALTRRAAVHAYLVARAGNGASSGSFRYQNTIVNVLREHLVFVLSRFLPHVHEELCARTAWASWQTAVVACMDAMRDDGGGGGGSTTSSSSPPSSVLRVVAPSTLPPKTLYQVKLVSFVEALAHECESFLDKGLPTTALAPSAAALLVDNGVDGCERPADAVFTPDMDLVLRHLLSRYRRWPDASGRSPPPLLPVATMPTSYAEFEAAYVPASAVPLVGFYATPTLVREYRAAHELYQAMPTAATAAALVRFVVECCGMYQFMLLHAFVRAQYDREHVYAFPLAEHLARAQARVLRARLGVGSAAPLARHLMTSFVCVHCRRFCSKLVPADAEPDGALATSGSDRVCFQNTSLEHRIAARLRAAAYRLPGYAELEAEAARHGGTLFEWYRANATVDDAAAIYPADPTSFNAPPYARAVAERWLDAVDAERPERLELDAAEYVRDEARPTLHPREPSAPLADMARAVAAAEPDALHRAFLARWAERNGRAFLAGHRFVGDGGGGDSVIWTCGSKKYKTEERKTRKAADALHRIADAITVEERETAFRLAHTRRRRDYRSFYEYSLCPRARVHAVSMLGSALVLDGELVLACCECLAYTALRAAHWRGALLVCSRCVARRTTGAPSLATTCIFDKLTASRKRGRRAKHTDADAHPAARAAAAAVDGDTARECRLCRVRLADDEPGAVGYAAIDAHRSWRLLRLRLCAEHADALAWLTAASPPLYVGTCRPHTPGSHAAGTLHSRRSTRHSRRQTRLASRTRSRTRWAAAATAMMMTMLMTTTTTTTRLSVRLSVRRKMTMTMMST